MATRIRILSVLIVGHVLSFGCAEILGIEAAVCDEKVDPKCSPKAAPSETSPQPEASAPSKDAASDAQAPDAASEAGPPPATCESYCDTIQESCTTLPQYRTLAACTKVCDATFGPNPDTDPTGDTLTCRAARAQAAADFGDDACVEAGMTGGGTCGQTCAVYCAQLSAICPEQFDTLGDCAAVCAGVPRTGMPFSSPAKSANTLECRFYHLQLATDGMSSLHCNHAIGGPPGDRLCSDTPSSP
jgi:hypothetical protein